MKVYLLFSTMMLAGVMAAGQDLAKTSGPFGFECGMTREQVIALVGKDGVTNSHDNHDILEVKTPPKPNKAFDHFYLVFSPRSGLVKLIASGVTIQTGDTGAELKEVYEAVVKAVTAKYGSTDKIINSCTGNDYECSNPDFYMMSLEDKNRKLMTFWFLKEHPINSVVSIMVEAKSLNMREGWVSVAYEFEGFHEYASAKEKASDETY